MTQNVQFGVAKDTGILTVQPRLGWKKRILLLKKLLSLKRGQTCFKIKGKVPSGKGSVHISFQIGKGNFLCLETKNKQKLLQL